MARHALAQNLGAVAFPYGVDGIIPAGRRGVIDLDHPFTAGEVAAGRLSVLEDGVATTLDVEEVLAAPAPTGAAELVAYLEQLPDTPAGHAEAARIAELERAGRARSTVLAAAQRFAILPPSTSPEE